MVVRKGIVTVTGDKMKIENRIVGDIPRKKEIWFPGCKEASVDRSERKYSASDVQGFLFRWHKFHSLFPFPPSHQTMVQLILSSTKGTLTIPQSAPSQLTYTPGNQGLRYFPYSGYLGLTPVRVEGSMSCPFLTVHVLISSPQLYAQNLMQT